MPSVRDSAPYASFWQAGYEGADHINQAGVPLQLNRDTGHLQRAREDYDLLQQFGIRTVRESAGWRLCERDGRYDFSSLDSRLRAARELGLQICWTFCHYGWPQDLDFLGPEFVPRFARYCRALAEYLAPWAGPQPVYTPLNEISFTSWNLTRGQFYCMNMHDPRAGHEGKRQLVRAQLAGCDAIRAVTPGARFLVTDPLIHITAPSRRPDLRPLAAALNASQFEAWDMLSGRAAPELGGAPDYLDLIGANYYHSNQWECCDDQRLWWHLGDPLRAPLHRLLTELHHRYGRPLLLAETSHVGSGRGAWLRDVASEAVLAVQHGADLRGVCLYPVVDRPDWEDPRHWHRAGLWDMDRHGPDPLARRLVQPYADALRQAQELTTRLCTCADTQMRDMPTIVVFSHLRWDAFSHRPQQLLTRLAPYYRIVYVEEPVHGDGGAYLVSSAPAPNVTVVRPHTPAGAGGFGDGQLAALQPLLAGLAPPGADVIAWFCTPMALPLLPALDARLVVYDCIDELSAHRHAPRQLPQREKALLTIADLVFTAGPGLHRARRAQHPAVHCFPGSVDAIHFEQALDRDNTHPAHDAIAHPRLGYHGPFDECVDTTLLAAIADARPDWQLVMVGSVREAAALTLPRRPNIHYLGRQPYQAIPHLLAGWDVCLLPLALNHATRHANPAQVLEYMAAALPIVSTDIADIRQAYGDVVRICRTHGQFIAACDDALALPPEHRDAMALRMRDIVGRSSWQATADAMRALLDSTPARQGGSA
ncbi:glycosyltransferase, partial [Duganella callida]